MLVFDNCLVIIVPVSETNKPLYKMYITINVFIQHYVWL